MTANLPICRTCLEQITEKEFPLTGELGFNVNLNVVSMLEFCTSTKLELSKDLPDSVCLKCFKLIGIAYTFLKQANESEHKLHEKSYLKYQQLHEEHEDEEKPGVDSTYVDNCLSCHDYADQSTNRSPSIKNEPLDDNYEDNEATSRDEVTDIYKKLNLKYHLMMNKECENERNPNAESANADDSLSYQDYVEQNTNRSFPVENEPLDLDDNYEKNDTITGNEVTDIRNIGEQLGNGKIEIETIEEQRSIEVAVPKRNPQLVSFDCPLCDKRILKQNAFMIHVKAHGIAMINCTKCDLQPSFDLPNYFKHYKKVHRYPCEYCDKSLVTKQGYDDHIRLHTTSVRYQIYSCNLCDSTFPERDNLNYHMKQHVGKRDHLCTLCGKTFYEASALKVHILRHPQTKMFICEMCGEGFGSNLSLKKHIENCKKKINKTAFKLGLRFILPKKS